MPEVYFTARRSKRTPVQSGELLREVVLPALKMNVTDVAARLLVSRQQLHSILAEKAGISPEMALRLGKFCGNGPDLWLSIQQAYYLWRASKNVGREIQRIRAFTDGTAPDGIFRCKTS